MARDLILVLLVLAGALGGSQVPRFVQEYEQRLGGAQQEDAREMAQFEALAGTQGLHLDAYLGRLSGSPDPAIRATGVTVAGLRLRLAELDRQVRLLRTAGWLGRPFVVLINGDRDLLHGTWRTFRFGLTVDPAFAAIGILMAYLAHRATGALTRSAWRKVRRRA